jgi:hypothetical protein
MSAVQAYAINVAQAATSTTSAQAIAARAGRRRLLIKNIDSSITIYIGIGTVTSSTGMPLLAGESVALETNAAVNALSASGTPSLAYIEEF